MRKFLISRKWLLILLGLLIAVSVALVVLFLTRSRRGEPGGGPISNPRYGDTGVGKISFSGKMIEVPGILPIYKNSGIKAQDFAVEIAAKLGLTQTSFSKNAWLSGDGKTILTYYPIPGRIEYSIDNSELRDIGVRPNDFAAKTNAREFLASIGLEKNLADEPKDINYYEGSELVGTTAEKADVLELIYQQQLDGLPLTMETSPYADIQVWVGRQNRVIKVVFPAKLTPTEKYKETTTFGLAEAISTVEGGRGQIIQITTTENLVLNRVNLGDISLDEVVLEYRLSEKDGLFYPYYRFLGTSFLQSNQQEQVFVNIITPAIKITYP